MVLQAVMVSIRVLQENADNNRIKVRSKMHRGKTMRIILQHESLTVFDSIINRMHCLKNNEIGQRDLVN